MERQKLPSHLRPFDVEKAKNGAKVVTFNNRDAEILKYGINGDLMIVLIDNYPYFYNTKGEQVRTALNYDGYMDLALD